MSFCCSFMFGICNIQKCSHGMTWLVSTKNVSFGIWYFRNSCLDWQLFLCFTFFYKLLFFMSKYRLFGTWSMTHFHISNMYIPFSMRTIYEYTMNIEMLISKAVMALWSRLVGSKMNVCWSRYHLRFVTITFHYKK